MRVKQMKREYRGMPLRVGGGCLSVAVEGWNALHSSKEERVLVSTICDALDNYRESVLSNVNELEALVSLPVANQETTEAMSKPGWSATLTAADVK